MIVNNKLDKSFGPVGSSSGMFLFFAGIILTYFYFSGIFILLIGAFVGFSYSSVLIDYGNKRVRFSNNLFGIIKTGKWIPIEPGMKLGIRESKATWRAYSSGNRSLNIGDNDFRIVLLDTSNKEIMPLKKTNSLDSAEKECEALVNQLGLGMI